MTTSRRLRRGDLRATPADRHNEAEIEALCQRHGTTTEGAFRSALQTLDLSRVLEAGHDQDDASRAPELAGVLPRRGSCDRRRICR